MLNQEIFALNKMSRHFQGPECDEGIQESLTESSRTVPAPKARVTVTFPRKGSERPMGRLKGGHLSPEPDGDGQRPYGYGETGGQDSRPSQTIRHPSGYQGGERSPIRCLTAKIFHHTIHLGLEGAEDGRDR